MSAKSTIGDTNPEPTSALIASRGPCLAKADLAKELENEIGLNNREATEFVNEFFEEIRRHLESGQPVKLSGFGNFTLRDKRARPGRNPKTGEVVPISARRVVTFIPGQKLRDRTS